VRIRLGGSELLYAQVMVFLGLEMRHTFPRHGAINLARSSRSWLSQIAPNVEPSSRAEAVAFAWLSSSDRGSRVRVMAEPAILTFRRTCISSVRLQKVTGVAGPMKRMRPSPLCVNVDSIFLELSIS
jgi:hypothetical protein